VPASRGMSSFQGFEDPPLDVESSSWKDRLAALYDQHPGRWAKYGPYSSKGSAQNVASHIRTQLDSWQLAGYKPEFQVSSNYIDVSEQELWFLYIKVGEPGGVQEES